MRLELSAGVSFALAAALLFGASTPVAKVLLGKVDPILLAGLLYLGSGSGLAFWWWLRSRLQRGDSQEASLQLSDLPWLAGAILAGGIVGPILLMVGLALTPASSASLLLNLEGVFTAVIAWFVFKEHCDRRIVLGMVAITAGGLLLSWTGQPELKVPWGAVAIVGACFAWGIDNNLTRKIALGDPRQIAGVKGLIAGTVNLALAHVAGTNLPSFSVLAIAALVGFLSYGVSLTLFILALRHIGTARTGAYFSVAPFIGAALSILVLGERLTISFLAAAGLMGIGVWLHLTERHEHEHRHELLKHDHRHVHDEHHQHEHSEESHSHSHWHQEIWHSHSHYPDIHHRHGH
ncbi:MAG TPA: DMT family transporter [Candidatus Binatia bacterium]|nr:DMT family transporter [Candidatus Binatia bacterium]